MKYRLMLAILLIGVMNNVKANELHEPPVFSSDKKTRVLDLLMIAKTSSIAEIPNVTAWVYEICERKYSIGDTCIAGKQNTNPYGGARLQLNAGDTLKVHFINKLPLITDSDKSSNDGEEFLAQNPTNIHTHGMLVSPSAPLPTDTNQLFGDNIFVLTFNSANGAPKINESSHIHGAINNDATDYQITLPAHHPSGLFWFHPHAHGISLNQISAGLSGIITVGQVSDYVKGLPHNLAIRHLILKDTQVNSDFSMQDQEDPGFCDLPSSTPGECENSKGGKWHFTVNGQKNPIIDVKAAGEIWRITNASGSATYELQLSKKNKSTSTPPNGMVMQLLSIDGVSVTPSRGSSLGHFRQIGGAKFKPVTCPGSKWDSPPAICATQLHMMPSSRAEVWVVNRDAKGNIINGDGSHATLETVGYATGLDADDWPAVELAQVTFNNKESVKHSPVFNIQDDKHDKGGLNYIQIAKDLATANAAVNADTNCKPLPKGWKRRIYFGYPTPDDFGLGQELIDEKGNAVPGTFQDVTEFTGMGHSICLPLASGNMPVYEHWEVVNLTGEDHNFHIHQTKFRVLTPGEITGTDTGLSTKSILQDNVPLLAGNEGCDGTYLSWKNGSCQSHPIDVEIPFAIAGDFVYHCHILEHEDGGMMETIHVVSAPDAAPNKSGHDTHHH
ncbi:multicopper oxidase domain-containing protein [Methylomonas sp. AM2-LC]|uniref:multicopper oxidase family protein n=1 Tax=Methylomonas sp. AM2-LC TaxID=3153301 RepID=UPI003266D93E